MILETQRLWLREMTNEDIHDLCEILCDEDVMYAYEHAFSFEEVQTWLARQLQRYAEDGVGLWAIIRKEDGVMVGQCGITKQMIRNDEVWEIGYLLKKAYWHLGYAREAVNGCKTYAFETLKMNKVYSIIREHNHASKRVAISVGMKKVDQFVKHYVQMDMPHDVYCIEHNVALCRVYMDAEFDAVKLEQRFHQMVISIGAVVCDEHGKQLDTFYETIRPRYYQRTSRVVLKMTGLSEDVIRSSCCLQEVLSRYQTWLEQFQNHGTPMVCYSFGPDDRRTLIQHCHIEKVEKDFLFEHIKDLQKPLSASVVYHDKIVSPTLSLDDLKLTYDIAGNVEHNALTDALDLMRIHQAYLQKKPCNQAQIAMIVQRKIAKQEEAKLKQQKRLHAMIKKRFAFVKKPVVIVFHPEVLEQFRNWNAQDHNFPLHFKKDYMVYENVHYIYDQLYMQMEVHTKEAVPYVQLDMHYETSVMQKKFLLHYRNASTIEHIFKQVEAFHEA